METKPSYYYVLTVDDAECEEGSQEWSFGFSDAWTIEDIVLYCAGVLLMAGYDNSDFWKVFQIEEDSEEIKLVFNSAEDIQYEDEETDSQKKDLN